MANLFYINYLKDFNYIDVYLNNANHTLDWSEKKAKRKIRRLVLKVYGVAYFNERPFHFYAVNDYVLGYGTLSKKWTHGGVFLIVVNRRNGAVEYYTHFR